MGQLNVEVVFDPLVFIHCQETGISKGNLALAFRYYQKVLPILAKSYLEQLDRLPLDVDFDVSLMLESVVCFNRPSLEKDVYTIQTTFPSCKNSWHFFECIGNRGDSKGFKERMDSYGPYYD